jgi:hypothetical protein
MAPSDTWVFYYIRRKKKINFKNEVQSNSCPAKYSVINFRFDFYICSRNEAKYQMCHWLWQVMTKTKKKKEFATREDLGIFTELLEHL